MGECRRGWESVGEDGRVYEGMGECRRGWESVGRMGEYK